jgi:hypothetical protein
MTAPCRRHVDESRSPFDPRDPAVEIVDPNRQIGEVHLDFGDPQTQHRNLAHERTEVGDASSNFSRCATCSERIAHSMSRIRPVRSSLTIRSVEHCSAASVAVE